MRFSPSKPLLDSTGSEQGPLIIIYQHVRKKGRLLCPTSRVTLKKLLLLFIGVTIWTFIYLNNGLVSTKLRG